MHPSENKLGVIEDDTLDTNQRCDAVAQEAHDLSGCLNKNIVSEKMWQRTAQH